jgi:hypothetical protein
VLYSAFSIVRCVACWSVVRTAAFLKSEKQHKVISRPETKDADMDFFALFAVIRLDLKIDSDFSQTPTSPAQRLEAATFFQRFITASQF